MAYSEHLAIAGIRHSTGAVGSSYDSALAESVIGPTAERHGRLTGTLLAP